MYFSSDSVCGICCFASLNTGIPLSKNKRPRSERLQGIRKQENGNTRTAPTGRIRSTAFSHPGYTVGSGVAPDQLKKLAGFHRRPGIKRFLFFTLPQRLASRHIIQLLFYITTLIIKNQPFSLRRSCQPTSGILKTRTVPLTSNTFNSLLGTTYPQLTWFKNKVSKICI